MAAAHRAGLTRLLVLLLAAVAWGPGPARAQNGARPLSSPCALLDESGCSVYASRPIPCAGDLRLRATTSRASDRMKPGPIAPPPPELLGAAVAVTVTDCDADPPGPVQASV